MTTRKNKNKSKDEVYIEEGLVVEDKGTTMSEFHDKNKKMEKAFTEAQEETGVVITATTKESLENGDKIELPARIAFQEQNIALSRLPIWFLNALSSMSLQELENFKSKYKNELSVSELASIDIIDGLMKKDKDSANIFWTIQMKMLNKTNVANQINVNIQDNNNSVSRMLDEITNKIAAAGQIVNPPTP